MIKRILAIAVIFLGTTAAWCILGSTIFLRTASTTSSLSGRVASTWGDTQEQTQPDIHYLIEHLETVTSEEKGKRITRQEKSVAAQPVALDASKIRADFHLDYRQKGLLWFSTYQVAFQGEHSFHNPTTSEQTFEFRLALPAQKAVYDGLALYLDGKQLALTFGGGVVAAKAVIPAGASGLLKATYRSQGQKSWRYRLGQATTGSAIPHQPGEVSEANDFHMMVRTDFGAFDFPDNSLSPTTKEQKGKGWELRWDYQNLVSGFDIALVMPEKLQPGPLAGEISYFAPVSLFFFFFLVFILSTLRGIDLHPMNYLFLACAFFSFHLLLAYLADHISIHWAFAISSAVSMLLVVTYLRLAVNLRFALCDAGLAQLVYLVLFSYAFFFQGFTGLAITIGAILSLFVVMQMTGRIHWEEKFARREAMSLRA
ncbi:MAG TPA: inner membrane CreD family protein [Candidatus Acidoferrum sp.]|nr:inner membrane CreD family protein [Candidatus Acidoferrum sp.]